MAHLLRNNDIEMQRAHRKGASGFTLVELMIVVLIIGILGALAVPRFRDAARKAKYSQARMYLKYIYQAATIFYTENGCYPADVNPNIPPPGLIPNYADEWPSPVRDPMNSVYDYEEWPRGSGSSWVGVVYLGGNLLHDGGTDFGSAYTSYEKSGEMIDYGDDVFIVIDPHGRACD